VACEPTQVVRITDAFNTDNILIPVLLKRLTEVIGLRMLVDWEPLQRDFRLEWHRLLPGELTVHLLLQSDLAVAHLVKEVDTVLELLFFSQLVGVRAFANTLVYVAGLTFLTFAFAN